MAGPEELSPGPSFSTGLQVVGVYTLELGPLHSG